LLAVSLADPGAHQLLSDGGAVVPDGDTSNVIAGPGLDRSQARGLVFDALTIVVRGVQAETVDEGQELYADLGMDSLNFAQLLVELETRLGIQLDDEDLMTIELVTVADLIDLVERISRAPEK
jgi:acyl carrier protein